MIDNYGAYKAKIQSCMTTRVAGPERCPKCGSTSVATARTAAGKSYLAELRVDETSDGTRFYYAIKGQPHFATCPGTPAPGALAKGVRVRVVKGRKVPKGTEGVAFWFGPGDYGERMGLKDDEGRVWWTAVANVERIG